MVQQLPETYNYLQKPPIEVQRSIFVCVLIKIQGEICVTVQTEMLYVSIIDLFCFCSGKRKFQQNTNNSIDFLTAF